MNYAKSNIFSDEEFQQIMEEIDTMDAKIPWYDITYFSIITIIIKIKKIILNLTKSGRLQLEERGQHMNKIFNSLEKYSKEVQNNGKE